MTTRRGSGMGVLLTGLTVACGAAACGGAPPRAVAVSPPPKEAAPACARIHPSAGAAPLDRQRQGAAIALASQDGRVIAYVADEDDATIHVVDVEMRTELGTVAVPGAPSQIVLAPDGRLFVAVRDKATVAVFEPANGPQKWLEQRCTFATAPEPVALSFTPDDRTLLVSSGWGAALTAHDPSRGAALFRAPLAREPRAVVVSDDGKRAFVSHAVGSTMSVVALDRPDHPVAPLSLVGNDPVGAKRKKSTRSTSDSGDRPSCQGFALAKSIAPSGRIFAPQVLVDNGNSEERTGGYGTASGADSETADVAVVDEDTERPLASSLVVHPPGAVAKRERTGKCLLPRAAAVDPRRESLFVTCLGIDALIELDAASSEPEQAEKRRWTVASGPTGVAVDASHDRVLVWSQFDRTLDVVALGAPDLESQLLSADLPVVRVAMSRRAAPPATADIALGRKLFHAAGDRRISSDGRACASCHPDGRDDAIVWATPDGPRQTPMLAGRLAGSAPYAWSGNGEDVKQHLGHTFQRLRGGGLGAAELDALVAYITTMRTPPRDPAVETADLRRGSAIFHSGEAGCSSCHGASGDVPDGSKHDVASRANADSAAEFDTPSLRFVGGTAPYFHDGRYKTLRELLVASDGKMGHTAHLTASDLDALETYLRTL